ncbi:MAG: phospho-N-acetylmuramoyl-pentapeptide-transferase [Schwartzia sp.]|nr:phospho-N-acetylmuramoyl-pentapeptide-transferase [Schwartzia sp. (in: firmicutes)]
MQKKNPIIGAILGLFLIGLPYSGGWKKGLIAFIGLTVVAVAANVMLGTALFSFVADAIGAYLGYTWTNEYNAAIDAQGTETPATL